MNIGSLFYILALVLFLFAWVGAAIVPNPIAGGFFCLTLGLLLGGVTLTKG